MNLQTRKLNFIQKFISIQNEEIVSHLERLLSKELKKYGDVAPMTMNELNARIDQSMNDSDKDRVVEGNDLAQRIRKWS